MIRWTFLGAQNILDKPVTGNFPDTYPMVSYNFTTSYGGCFLETHQENFYKAHNVIEKPLTGSFLEAPNVLEKPL